MNDSTDNRRNNSENTAKVTHRVFADPVSYLAEFGIESELVPRETLPAAA